MIGMYYADLTDKVFYKNKVIQSSQNNNNNNNNNNNKTE
jgi:hypothetical protein